MLAQALDGLLGLFMDRMLSFDTGAARRYAELAVTAKRLAGEDFKRLTATLLPLQRRVVASWPLATPLLMKQLACRLLTRGWLADRNASKTVQKRPRRPFREFCRSLVVFGRARPIKAVISLSA